MTQILHNLNYTDTLTKYIHVAVIESLKVVNQLNVQLTKIVSNK